MNDNGILGIKKKIKFLRQIKYDFYLVKIIYLVNLIHFANVLIVLLMF
jgi:hypothetical protein